MEEEMNAIVSGLKSREAVVQEQLGIYLDIFRLAQNHINDIEAVRTFLFTTLLLLYFLLCPPLWHPIRHEEMLIVY